MNPTSQIHSAPSLTGRAGGESALVQIGERLRGLRDALDIPAQEVADLCGLSLETYERVEQGEADITISKLMTIANHYGISTEALIFDEHVFTGCAGTNVLRLLPPLCLSMEEAGEFIEKFRKSLTPLTPSPKGEGE